MEPEKHWQGLAEGRAWKAEGRNLPTGLIPDPPATHLDRLSVTCPQEALVVRLDAKSHKGARGDVPPVPARCHAFPTLENKNKNGEMTSQVRSKLETLTRRLT